MCKNLCYFEKNTSSSVGVNEKRCKSMVYMDNYCITHIGVSDEG